MKNPETLVCKRCHGRGVIPGPACYCMGFVDCPEGCLPPEVVAIIFELVFLVRF